MAPKKTAAQKHMDKAIADERKLVMRQSAEIRLPKDASLQQVIDRLELAKRQGIPASAKLGTDRGYFLGGGRWEPLYSLSVRFGEVREGKS